MLAEAVNRVLSVIRKYGSDTSTLRDMAEELGGMGGGEFPTRPLTAGQEQDFCLFSVVSHWRSRKSTDLT